MESFRRVLEDSQLMDVGFFGNQFTWGRGNLPETIICEWLDLFPNFSIQHLPHTIFYHFPLLIKTDQENLCGNRGNIRFESWWMFEESCEEEIKRIWKENSGTMFEKLEVLARGLKEWERRIK